jgi:hypothetical protein
MILSTLAPAYGHDDFKLIAFRQNGLVELTARDNFAISLYGDTLALQSHVLQQLGHVQRHSICVPSSCFLRRDGKALGLTINDKLYHF